MSFSSAGQVAASNANANAAVLSSPSRSRTKTPPPPSSSIQHQAPVQQHNLATNTSNTAAAAATRNATAMNAILARALQQANPAMLHALANGTVPPQPKEQGVQALPTVASSSSGPATAALQAHLAAAHQQRSSRTSRSSSMAAGKARPVAASKQAAPVPAVVPTAAAAVPIAPFRAQDYVPMSMIAARLAGYARPSTQAELQKPFVSAADSAVAALTAAHQAHMVASSNKVSTPAPELLLLREQLSQLTELTEQCHYFGAVPNPLCSMQGGSPTTTECGVKNGGSGGGNSKSTSNCNSNNSNSNANSNRSSSMTFSNSNSSSNAPPTSHSRSSSSSTLTDQDFGSTTSHQSESGHAHVSSSSLLSSSVPNPLLSQQQQQEQHKQEDENPQHDENEDDDEYNQQDDDEMEERRTPAIDATSATIQTADNPGDHEEKTTRPTVVYTTSKSQTLVFTTNKGIVG